MPSPTRSVAFAHLVPIPTDRVVLVGQTGSGKTTLARHLLRARRYVVVHDAKGTLHWPGYRVYSTIDQLVREVDRDPLGIARIIYRPEAIELRDRGAAEAFCQWVYERRATTLYADELYALSMPWGLEPLPALWACITRGREHGVEVWAATQRPYRIPLAMLSEAEHYYVFRLRDAASRHRVEELTGLSVTAQWELPKTWFYYISADSADRDPLGPLRLDLSRVA